MMQIKLVFICMLVLLAGSRTTNIANVEACVCTPAPQVPNYSSTSTTSTSTVTATGITVSTG